MSTMNNELLEKLIVKITGVEDIGLESLKGTEVYISVDKLFEVVKEAYILGKLCNKVDTEEF